MVRLEQNLSRTLNELIVKSTAVELTAECWKIGRITYFRNIFWQFCWCLLPCVILLLDWARKTDGFIYLIHFTQKLQTGMSSEYSLQLHWVFPTKSCFHGASTAPSWMLKSICKSKSLLRSGTLKVFCRLCLLVPCWQMLLKLSSDCGWKCVALACTLSYSVSAPRYALKMPWCLSTRHKWVACAYSQIILLPGALALVRAHTGTRHVQSLKEELQVELPWLFA